MLFVMLRSIVGVAALTAVIILRKYIFNKTEIQKTKLKDLIFGGTLCGLAIVFASSFQQLGLITTAAGKSGFLTALYIIIVPLLGIFFKRKTSNLLYFAVILGLIGAYLLCGGIENISIGDIFTVGCAFMFSIHILIIDRYAPKCDCVMLSCVQFSACAVFACAGSLIFREAWIYENIIKSLPFWIFCGIGSSAVAFTLQMYAQKFLHPVTASLLMSLESVFALIGGYLFLNEKISLQELIGCVVIFAAVIIAQIPVKNSVPQEEQA
jgi:drug/metabolite transporter (DMT)-like permease